MDARVSEVVVTLDKRWEKKRDQALSALKKCGLEVRGCDEDCGVVEGNIDVSRVHDLEKLDAVDYVRTVFTYFANYPPGDPRDVDGR
jgi:hypothetical protein